MERSTRFIASLAFRCVCALAVVEPAWAQYGTPLTMQGLDHTSFHSAVSRGSGGLSIGVRNDVSLMFANPASLLTLDGIQLSIGGLHQSVVGKQDQQYGALQSYADFHALLESATGNIPPLDTGRVNPRVRSGRSTQADSVQRPFGVDSLTMPGWSRSKSKTLPLEAFAAIPFTIEGITVAAGAGMVEYANLNWYYQNNNELSPNILDVANNGIILNASLPDADSSVYKKGPPYMVQWYQTIQQRDGSIYGYGAAVAATVTPRLNLGASLMVLSGTTRDYEAHIGRGRMAFYSNSLRLSQQGIVRSVKSGTSDYSGVEVGLSGTYDTRYVRFGFAVKLPTTVTRDFKGTLTSDSVASTTVRDGRIDSVHVLSSSSFSGQDKMRLPWRGTVGVGISIRENLTVGVEYEFRAYASATYTDPSGAASQPWLSSTVIRCGAEFRPTPWLTLRAGVRQNAEVFEGATNALRGDAVRYPVYSIGCGLAFEGARLTVAYEYADMRYVDTWSNAAHTNRQFTNAVVASLAYTLPWMVE